MCVNKSPCRSLKRQKSKTNKNKNNNDKNSSFIKYNVIKKS